MAKMKDDEIRIALNQGKVLSLSCKGMHPDDMHTLAKQITEAPMVYSTHVGDMDYYKDGRHIAWQI